MNYLTELLPEELGDVNPWMIRQQIFDANVSLKFPQYMKSLSAAPEKNKVRWKCTTLHQQSKRRADCVSGRWICHGPSEHQ